MRMNLALRTLFIAVVMVAPLQAHAAEVNQDPQILHLLNRISFGPAPGDMQNVRQMGMEAYIEQQLHPERIPVPPALQQRLDQLDIEKATLYQIAQNYQLPNGVNTLPEDQRKQYEQRLNTVLFELSEQKILRAMMSPAQLQEVMTDFWFNHFNVFIGKNEDRVATATYERDAIRPYALGKFRDLLKATAVHPAMLFYLDNWQNTDPQSVFARKVAMKQNKEPPGINENYAREIMELHTLGVDGGYTQQDVTTLAHVLTGWGLTRGKDWADRSAFYFDPTRHDYTDEILLKHTIRGGGPEEVDATLDMLAAHPSTAHHIAYELAQYFVADNPPESLVEKLDGTFRSTDGNIAAMLRTLFTSSEFWDPHYAQVKFKPPFRYVISALRASGAVVTGDTRMIQGTIGGMGEPLYRCQTPNGYAITNDEWLNSDGVLKRINIAKSFVHYLNDQAGETIFDSMGRGSWSASTLSSLTNVNSQMKAVLLLSSPEFLYY